MKKLLLILAIISIQSNAAASDANLKQALKKMIGHFGYSCRKVDKVTRFSFSEGFHVWCDAYRYHYELENKGGRLIVTVK